MNQISTSGPLLPESPDPDLEAAISRLGHANVLVVGDVMLDKYVYGDVNRISVEAPVPIVAVDREVEMPGGAGNVLRNLTSLGAAAVFITVVGDDTAGSALTALIGGHANVEPWLLVQGGRITTQKTRFFAKGHQLFRADREQTDPIHARLAERMIRIAVDAMAATSVTVLSDYGKGVLAGDVPTRLLEAARACGRPLIVDPRGVDFTRYAGADIVMPNRPELAAATGMPVDSEAAIVAAATALRQEFAFGAVVVTRGNDGMTLVDADGARHFPAEAAEIYDTSGSGDTALATLAAAVAAKLPLPVAVRLANIAAGVVVGKVGVAVAREAELLAAVSPELSATRKVVSLEEAAERAERWRHRGWRVGFTSGCFDLLHPGHLHLLNSARTGCDRLIVGLHSDDAARRVKGPSRPVQSQQARAEVLAGLASVDLVAIFDEDSPERLIRAVRPDVVITGGAGCMDDGIGVDLVREWGGMVTVADFLPGHSTQATLERIRG
jgi:D-beta-D-heptose 7-phosphate kinase / D-beta-D-heptose 1-phosphate adenosyltransferase